MNADVNIEKKSPKAIWIVLVCVLVAGLTAAVYWAYQNRSKSIATFSAEDGRDTVAKYLNKKSGRDNFQISLDTVKKDKRPWETLPKQYDSASDYETVYRLIGEHLWVADSYLRSAEKKDQRIGVRLIMAATEAAEDVAVDDWLACRICEGYLVPLFKNDEKLSDEDEQLIHFVGRRYAGADEKENEIDLEKFYLSKTESGRRADWVRYRLARLLQSTGRDAEAQQVLAEMKAATATSKSTVPEKKLEKIQKLTNSAAKN